MFFRRDMHIHTLKDLHRRHRILGFLLVIRLLFTYLLLGFICYSVGKFLLTLCEYLQVYISK